MSDDDRRVQIPTRKVLTVRPMVTPVKAQPRPSKLEITESCGNVFRDLGFSEEESEKLTAESEAKIAAQRAKRATP